VGSGRNFKEKWLCAGTLRYVEVARELRARDGKDDGYGRDRRAASSWRQVLPWIGLELAVVLVTQEHEYTTFLD